MKEDRDRPETLWLAVLVPAGDEEAKNALSSELSDALVRAERFLGRYVLVDRVCPGPVGPDIDLLNVNVNVNSGLERVEAHQFCFTCEEYCLRCGTADPSVRCPGYPKAEPWMVVRARVAREGWRP